MKNAVSWSTEKISSNQLLCALLVDTTRLRTAGAVREATAMHDDDGNMPLLDIPVGGTVFYCFAFYHSDDVASVVCKLAEEVSDTMHGDSLHSITMRAIKHIGKRCPNFTHGTCPQFSQRISDRIG